MFSHSSMSKIMQKGGSPLNWGHSTFIRSSSGTTSKFKVEFLSCDPKTQRLGRWPTRLLQTVPKDLWAVRSHPPGSFSYLMFIFIPIPAILYPFTVSQKILHWSRAHKGFTNRQKLLHIIHPTPDWPLAASLARVRNGTTPQAHTATSVRERAMERGS